MDALLFEMQAIGFMKVMTPGMHVLDKAAKTLHNALMPAKITISIFLAVESI